MSGLLELSIRDHYTQNKKGVSDDKDDIGTKLNNLEQSRNFSGHIQAGIADFRHGKMIESFDLWRSDGRKQDRLESRHAHAPKQMDCIRCQVAAAACYMRTDHRNKMIIGTQRFKQVGRGEFDVIGHRVGTAYFKFNPRDAG